MDGMEQRMKGGRAKTVLLRSGGKRKNESEPPKHANRMMMKGGGIECDRLFEQLVDDGDFEAGVKYGQTIVRRPGQCRYQN